MERRTDTEGDGQVGLQVDGEDKRKKVQGGPRPSGGLGVCTVTQRSLESLLPRWGKPEDKASQTTVLNRTHRTPQEILPRMTKVWLREFEVYGSKKEGQSLSVAKGEGKPILFRRTSVW